MLGEKGTPFQGFFDDNTLVMLLVEPESGQIIAANPAAARFYGYPVERLSRLRISDINTADPAHTRAARMRAVRKEANAFEFQHRRSDGELRDVEVFATPVRDGPRTLLLSIIHDSTARKQAERALQASEERLRAAGEIVYDRIYRWDPGSDQIEWLDRGSRAPGGPIAEVPVGVADWMSMIHPDDHEGARHAWERRRHSSETFEHEYRIRSGDGSYRHWLDRSSPLVDDAGPPFAWVGGCTDVTERKRSDEKLRLAATVFTSAQEGIVITDRHANIIDVNDAFTRITGYTRDEALGRNPRFLSSGRQGRDFYETMWRSLHERGFWLGELWNRHKDGTLFAELLSISSVRGDNGDIQNYVALLTDVTEQKAYKERLEHIAYHDSLTNLPNRALLSDRLHQAIAQARRHATTVAVVYLDLDGFKEVNDGFGHDVGDRLLIEIAGRLQNALREEDTVARLGGDEFVVVLVGLPDPGACADLLPRLLAAATRPLRVDDQVHEISASLGVTFFPQPDPVDPDQLLRQADQAMYQAKLDGKNRFHLFDAEQDRNVRGQVERLGQIRAALQSREFVLHYQPKVNMRTGEVVGAEALIRWPQGSGGMRQPADFLPLVENHLLAATLGEWVLETALTQVESWKAMGLHVPVSVNVSGCHLQQTDFIDRLRRMLQTHPAVDPADLTIEILETTALMDLAHVSSIIQQGQQLGIVFALDDFGTGYSSLSYLKSLPAGQLKIDRSFVRDMLDDRDDLAILEGIMGLAAAFRREAIAEGVETAEHGELLLQLGCELAQGFFIGRPMSADDFVQWVDSWQPPPGWRRQHPIQTADLPLVFALVEHRAWVNEFDELVTGNGRAELPVGADECHFGKWFRGEGEERYGARSEYEEIRTLHNRVHQVAEQLLGAYSEGRHDESLARLGELHDLREMMTMHLRYLVQAVGQPDR